jgi:8-amino-7-oxononanoate synthase
LFAVSLVEELARELEAIEERGLRRRLRSVDSAQAAEVIVDGRTVVNFSSNNYLGLANHPALRQAAIEAIVEEGVGAGAARLIVGNLRAHRRLETALATFHQTEAALLFPSGYQANVGVLAAVAGPEDVIFSDELNHASIIDGCRLSRAQVVVYRHCDMDDLGLNLARHSGRRRFIITDSVFSMDGDLAPLRQLRQLADENRAYLVVDEAHATGVVGPNGRGRMADLGLRSDIHMATLGKALGAAGAYVTGPRILVDHLLHRARSFVFTTGSPPAIAAAAVRALEIISSDEGAALRSALQARIERLAIGLNGRGLLVPGAGQSPIFPILIGDERRALAVTEALLARGIFAQAIRPPTVPRGTSRLRIALVATHTEMHVDSLLDALDATLGAVPRSPR